MLVAMLLMAAKIEVAAAQTTAGGSGRVPYLHIVFGERKYTDPKTDLTTACIQSLQSAIDRCKEAGGKSEDLTSLLPKITKTNMTKDDGTISSLIIGCEWNIACTFPSREAVPYLFSGQF